MKKVEKATQEIKVLFEPHLGEIRVKTYFSYYAFFSNKIMFALYKDDTFYLRKTISLIKNFPFIDKLDVLEDDDIGLYARNFFITPNTFLQEVTSYISWIYLVIDDVESEMSLRKVDKQKLIRYLPNMNLKIERMLSKVNICSTSELCYIGSINAFIRLLKQGNDINSNFLFKLYGAEHHRYLHTITEKEKKEIIKEANIALYNAGLRYRLS